MLPLFIRSIKFLIGGGFIFVLALALFGTVKESVLNPQPESAEEVLHKHPKKLELASDGPLGRFDNKQLQRGFQVYKEVCASCHSLNLASFRELAGIGYSEPEIKKIAKDWVFKQPVFDEKGGTWGERDNVPSDRFPKVYYAGTGTPPDLTLIAKARHNGPAYVYSLMTGYDEKPTAEQLRQFPEFAEPAEGMAFNPYFPNLVLSMPAPIVSDDQVTYVDGTRATVDQMSKDVSAFLAWTAEPHAQSRKRAGVAVILFLLFATGLAFGAYRTVWKGIKH